MSNDEWFKNAQMAEFDWWNGELSRDGLEEYKRKRAEYFADMVAGFGGRFEPRGDTVNVGMGLMSIFNFIAVDGKKVEVDPLADRYRKAIPDASATAFLGDVSELESNAFDTAICFNMIDHTPEPERIIQEIHRALKKSGVLYFEVNFDRYDSPAHYQKFGVGLVHELFGGLFDIVYENVKLDCGPLKNWDEYYAIMVKA